MERYFSRILVLLAAASLVPRLVLGAVMPIGFDGWWHLFVSTQDNWLMFFLEWRGVAHPPILSLLLRFLALFGHSPLLLRSAGILSGAATSIVVGLIGAKIYRHKVTALLAAAAYSFAWNIIEMNCDLRGYPFALLFLTAAFYYWLDWYAEPANTRSMLLFSAASCLAMLSEFYVLFLLAGCFGMQVLRSGSDSAYRQEVVGAAKANWKLWIASLAAPFLIFAGSQAVQMHLEPAGFPYLHPYLWLPQVHADLYWFLLANLGREIGYFAPFGVDSGVILPLVFFVAIPVYAYFFIARKDLTRGVPALAPVLMVPLLLAQIIVLSLLRKFPFGGLFRQQSILAPFVFLSAFLLLDLLVGFWKGATARNVLFALAGLLVAGSFATGWAAYPWGAAEPRSAEYKRFRQLFPTSDSVYADQASAIYYFGETHRAKWSFVSRILVDEQRVVEYRIDDGSGHPVRLFRNKNQPWTDLANPNTYRVLADTLRVQHLKSAQLYFVGLNWDEAAKTVLEERMRTLSPQAGLDIGLHEVGTTYAFAEFKLRD